MTEQQAPVEIIEKRRFLRLSDYFRVTFRSLDRQVSPTGPAPEGLGFSKNVSVGGVCFVADGPALLGEQLSLHIEIPEIDGGIAVVGEVVRCREVKPSRYELAVRFLPTGSDEKTREQLELFIYKHFF